MAAIRKKKFSVVIPTYTGQDHIADCFDSILAQDDLDKFNFDVIVVIDGPNQDLREIVDSQSTKFVGKGIEFYVYQFDKNKGRFEARQKGAMASANEYLLFLDDRNKLAHDYFVQVLKADREALIPNVLEESHPHFIAKTIYHIRKKLYGDKWGKDFKSYEINQDNFERSSKGTTSLWIKRELFMEACQAVLRGVDDLKTVNDDIRLMKWLVDNGHGIFRSSEVKIYYQPRNSIKSEIKHIFHRGPTFMDYYLRPGTRFYMPLILFYIGLVASLLLLVLLPNIFVVLAAALLAVVLLASFYVVGISAYAFVVFVGLIVIGASFILGLIRGMVLKLGHSKRFSK